MSFLAFRSFTYRVLNDVGNEHFHPSFERIPVFKSAFRIVVSLNKKSPLLAFHCNFHRTYFVGIAFPIDTNWDFHPKTKPPILHLDISA